MQRSQLWTKTGILGEAEALCPNPLDTALGPNANTGNNLHIINEIK